MKIFVFSDSHGDCSKMEKVIQKYKMQIDAIIHLGDHDGDMERIMYETQNIPVAVIAGNCDLFSRSKRQALARYGSKIFLLTHGSGIVSEGSYGGALKLAKENCADAVLFGHTHIPLCETREGILLFNPGSISRPRGGSTCSFGIIEINDNQINARCESIE